MANIKEIASRHKVDFEDKNDKAEGRLRRVWLDNETGFKQGLNRVETGFRQGLDNAKQGLNQVETGFKQGLKALDDLRGNPREVFISLVKNISDVDPYITRKLSLPEIAIISGIPRESVRTARKFLYKYNIIKRIAGGPGILGWAKYSLDKNLTDEILRQGLNSIQTAFKPCLNRVEIGAISSSSNNINTTTTEIPLEWNLDIEPLKEIGFTQNHIRQLIGGVLDPTVLQESIYAFAFDMKYNNLGDSIKKDPLRFFMGIVRTKKYCKPGNYKSPRAIELEETLAEKKAEAKIISDLEEELAETWLKTLSEADRDVILKREYPHKAPNNDSARGALLREYHKAKFPRGT
jgi:hypothetical protein